MEKNILKVYPSSFWHGDVVIIGNRQGLLQLKETIDSALSGKTVCNTVEEIDGHQYGICTKMHDGDLLDETWLRLPLHYNDEEITEEEKDFLSDYMLTALNEDCVQTT